MHIKERNRRQLQWTCAAILLTACCFRTAAVLQAEAPPPAEQAFESLAYTLPSEERTSLSYDASLVSIDDRAGADYDIDALLAAPLEIPISDEPVILIVHTHATEAYADTEDYRSEDCAENVVRIGEEIAQTLNANGICTLHDTTLHDAEGYDDAYSRTETAIAAYLEQYPSICMVIDVHRDAVQSTSGEQLPMTTILGGEKTAQLLLVMGTDTAELPHPNWQENLSFAVKLQAFIAEKTPDLFRDICLRTARYNEHMTPYSILLEVGAAGNTQAEALRAANYFATRLSALLRANAQSAP